MTSSNDLTKNITQFVDGWTVNKDVCDLTRVTDSYKGNCGYSTALQDLSRNICHQMKDGELNKLFYSLLLVVFFFVGTGEKERRVR